MLDLAQPDAITAADRSIPDDRRVHSNVGPMLLDSRSQDTTVDRKISLGQRCHNTATARSGDAQSNVVANSQGVTDPGIFHKRLSTLDRFHYDVGAKTPDLKTTLRIELSQPVECACRQQVDSRAIEKRSSGQFEIGDSIPVVEAIDV